MRRLLSSPVTERSTESDRQVGRQQRGHGRRSGIRIHRIDNHGLGSLRLGILRLILLSGGVVLSVGHHQIDTKIFGSGLSAITQIDKERLLSVETRSATLSPPLEDVEPQAAVPAIRGSCDIQSRSAARKVFFIVEFNIIVSFSCSYWINGIEDLAC